MPAAMVAQNSRAEPYRVLTPLETAWKPADKVSISWPLTIGVIMVIGGLISSANSRGGEYWLWIIAGALIAWYGYSTRPDRGAPPKDRDPAGYRAWYLEQARQVMAQACTPRPPARSFESESEQRLYSALERAHLSVHRQQMVPSGYGRGYEYCADIAYYDPWCGLRIDIEVDGSFKDANPELQGKWLAGINDSPGSAGTYCCSKPTTAPFSSSSAHMGKAGSCRYRARTVPNTASECAPPLRNDLRGRTRPAWTSIRDGKYAKLFTLQAGAYRRVPLISPSSR